MDRKKDKDQETFNILEAPSYYIYRRHRRIRIY